VKLSVGRIFTLFFVACFLGMPLCQLNELEPVQQDTKFIYAVELGEIVCPSINISSLVFPKQHAKINPKLVNQKAQLSQQRP